MMRTEILLLALIVGACNWAFRYLPIRADLSGITPGGALARVLAATGPAAIATLFVASLLPRLQADAGVLLPMVAGTAAVLGVYLFGRSVVGATLSGSIVYGLAHWLMA